MAFGDKVEWPFEQPSTPTLPDLKGMELLTIEQVMAMCQRSKAAIENDVAARRFPAPIKIGGSNRWLMQELVDFLMRKIIERNQRLAAAQKNSPCVVADAGAGE